MMIFSFVGGILIGALSAFLFMFVMVTISDHQKPQKKHPIVSDEVIIKLWHEYMKGMNDDGK